MEGASAPPPAAPDPSEPTMRRRAAPPVPEATPATTQAREPRTRRNAQRDMDAAEAATYWLRVRVLAPAAVVAVGAVVVGAIAAVALSARALPVAVAAFVATLSALIVRLALQAGAAAAHPARARGLRGVHRLTGERAAYVRTSQRLAMMDRDFTAADYEMLLDLDNNSTRLRRFLEGASQDFIDRLPTYSYVLPDSIPSNDEKQCDDAAAAKAARMHGENAELGGDTLRRCAICLEDFETHMKIRILPCWHRFMAACIDPWLLEQAKCPVCKASILD